MILKIDRETGFSDADVEAAADVQTDLTEEQYYELEGEISPSMLAHSLHLVASVPPARTEGYVNHLKDRFGHESDVSVTVQNVFGKQVVRITCAKEQALHVSILHGSQEETCIHAVRSDGTAVHSGKLLV